MIIVYVCQLPGKKGSGPTGWAVQAKVQMYFWLGLVKYKKELLRGLPEGYEDTAQLRRACRLVGSPPLFIKYVGNLLSLLRTYLLTYEGCIVAEQTWTSILITAAVTSLRVSRGTLARIQG